MRSLDLLFLPARQREVVWGARRTDIRLDVVLDVERLDFDLWVLEREGS